MIHIFLGRSDLRASLLVVLLLVVSLGLVFNLASAEAVTITGTMYHGVEAGCWLIRADDDGAEYLLMDTPEALRIDGLRVQVTGEIKTDMVSYCMQGSAALQITSYSILSSPTTTTVTVTTTSSLTSANVQPTTITSTLGTTTAVIVIPGFPMEAILVGIALGLLMLIVIRLQVSHGSLRGDGEERRVQRPREES